jgi:hypothetical protein
VLAMFFVTMKHQKEDWKVQMQHRFFLNPLQVSSEWLGWV